MSEALKYTVSADDSSLASTLNQVHARFKSLGDGISNITSGIQGAMAKVSAATAAVTAVVAGATLGIKFAVDATLNFTSEANKLARVLGISATEASALNVALGDVYTDADTYSAAAAKLTKEVRGNEGALRALGLRTRDANGNLRPMNVLMMESIQIVNTYKQGIDRNIAAQILWGRSADEMATLLKLNNQVLEEARAKQQALGLVVGKENVEAAKAYKAAMNDVGDVMLAVKKTVGDAFLPILTKLGEWFASIGPPLVNVFRVAMNSLATAIHVVIGMLESLWIIVRALADPLVTLGSAIGKLLSGDVSGASKDMMRLWQSWEKELGGVFDAVRANAARTQAAIAAVWAKPTAIPDPKPGGRSAGDLTKKGPEKTQMAEWEAELAAMKEAHAAQNAANGTFYEFSKEREREFWEAKRAIAAAGSQDAYGVQRKVTAAILEIQKDAFEERLAQLRREGDAAEQNYAQRRTIATQELALIQQRYGAQSKEAQDAMRRIDQIERQAAEQRKQLKLAEIAEFAAAGEAAVELARQQKQFELDMGLITHQELLAAERDLMQARYELRLAALNQARELIDPDKDPQEYRRRNDEILELELELERQHQQELAQIRMKQSLDQTKHSRDAAQGVRSTFEGAFSGLFNFTLSWSGFMKRIFAGIGDSFAQMAAKMVTDWIMNTVLMKAISAAMAKLEIMFSAARGAAAAGASAAAVPVVGWAAAPAAAAATFSLLTGFTAMLPSASQGWDIPAGLNPIVQLHEQEMVLPREQADVVRDMAAGGGGGQQPAGTIRAMPPGDWLMTHRADLVKALQGAGRDFVFTRF